MSRLSVALVVAILAGSLVMVGCSAAPAPAPTQAAAAPAAPAKATEPAKAAEPAKAPVAQPAAAPANPVDWPQRGKAITVIVPFAAGGTTDVAARLIAPSMEKDLGVPVQIVNKPGATTQIGAAELVASKPDGYTLMWVSCPTTLITYLDADRKANYSAKSFQPIAAGFRDSSGLAVAADSPYKTFNELIDAAKASTKKMKVGGTGLLGASHLAMVALQQVAGVKFDYLDFDAGSTAITETMGGHVDFAIVGLGNIAPMASQGKIRVLAVLGKDQSPLMPGVKTATEQGFPLDVGGTVTMITAPAGTPKEVVAKLDQSIKAVATTAEFKAKLNAVGMDSYYADSASAEKIWADMEASTKPLLDLAKASIPAK